MAKRCERCGYSLDDDAAFCTECGAKARNVCSRCGEELISDARFCGSCGTPVNYPSRPVVQNANFRREPVQPARKKMPPGGRADDTAIYRYAAAFAFVVALLCGGYWFLLCQGLNKQPPQAQQTSPAVINVPEPKPAQSSNVSQPQTNHAQGAQSLPATYDQQGQIYGTRVNLREYPDMKARVIYCFPGWEYVTLLSATSPKPGKYPWYMVSYGGVTGWVYGQFLRPQTVSDTPTGKSPVKSTAAKPSDNKTKRVKAKSAGDSKKTVKNTSVPEIGIVVKPLTRQMLRNMDPLRHSTVFGDGCE